MEFKEIIKNAIERQNLMKGELKVQYPRRVAEAGVAQESHEGRIESLVTIFSRGGEKDEESHEGRIESTCYANDIARTIKSRIS